MSRIVDAVILKAEENRIAKKSHANLSPSKAHRWTVCPGSVHVTDDAPETTWAAEGTRKHAVLAHVLEEGEDIRGGDLVHPLLAGDIIQTECGPYEVPREVLEQCHEIKDFIQDFKDTHEGWTVEVETGVEIGSRIWANMPPGECRGTADAVAYCWDELLVLDAKFGFVKVYPRGNPQLMLYALGLLSEVPYPIKWVTLCIAQPDYDGTVAFREHRMTVEELHEWAFVTYAVVLEILEGSRRLQADEEACRYCPARTQCPARMQALDDANNAAWMEGRSLEELLEAVPRLKAIAKDIEQRAMAEMNAGKPVRGWKLVASESKRKWQEEEKAGQALVPELQSLGLGGVEMFDSKLKSPAKMEKAIRATKKMTIKEAKAIVDKFAFKPAGGPKLVPDSDPRPALESTAWNLEDVLKASLEEHNDE